MIDVPRIRANLFLRRISRGKARNEPAIFECYLEGDGYTEFVVKFKHKLGRDILCEFVSSIIGIRLGLPVPAVAIIEIDNRLAQIIKDQELSEALVIDPGPHYGSMFVSEQYSVPLPGFPVPPQLIEQAKDIFAFDMLIQNPDRTFRQGKPNLLSNGERFVVIDHELSLSFLSLIGEIPEPWDLRDSLYVQNHIFFSDLLSYANANPLSFDGFIDRLRGLSDEEIDLLLDIVPFAWKGNLEWPEKIATYLRYVRDNADRFNRGLLEVFA